MAHKRLVTKNMDPEQEAIRLLAQQGIFLNQPAGLAPDIDDHRVFASQSTAHSGGVPIGDVNRAGDDSVDLDAGLRGGDMSPVIGLLSEKIKNARMDQFYRKQRLARYGK